MTDQPTVADDEQGLLRAKAEELDRIAELCGEADDPFAAWETIELWKAEAARTEDPRAPDQGELETAEKLVAAKRAGMREAAEYRFKEISDCIRQSGASWGVADWDDIRDFIGFAGKAFAEKQALAKSDQGEEVERLREALKTVYAALDAFTKEADWGKSVLSAETIRKVNEAPGVYARALLPKGTDRG